MGNFLTYWSINGTLAHQSVRKLPLRSNQWFTRKFNEKSVGRKTCSAKHSKHRPTPARTRNLNIVICTRSRKNRTICGDKISVFSRHYWLSTFQWVTCQFIFPWLLLTRIHLRTKGELSGFHSRDRRGPKFKECVRWPYARRLNGACLSLAIVAYLPRFTDTLEVFTFTRYRQKGFRILKSGSRDPDNSLLRANLLPCDAMHYASATYVRRLCVRPSVTFVNSVKTKKQIFKICFTIG